MKTPSHGADDITAAQFFSFFFESILFGIFLVLYGVALWVRMRKREDRRKRVIIQVGASTLMLLLAGSHLLVDVARGFEAFVAQDGHSNSAFHYFVDAQKPTFMAKMIIYITQTVLGDTVMAYRAFIVSGYKLSAMAIPAVLLIATAVSGYVACIEYPLAAWSLPSIGQNEGPQWLAAFLVLAFVSNLFTTTLIIVLVNRSNQNTLKLGGIPVAARRSVVVTIIQSAVLYTVTLFFLLVTFCAGINPEMFCIDVLPPLIGISFTLIIVIGGLRGWGDHEQRKDGMSQTDAETGSKTRGSRLRRLTNASTKLHLATATIASAFKHDERAAHVSNDQIYIPETWKRRLRAMKSLPPLPSAAGREDLESGKRGSNDNSS